MQFFKKWLAFFNPVPGWRKRLLSFKGGQTAWEVPGHPECSKVVPWPVQWIPHRTLTQEERDSAIQFRARAVEDPAFEEQAVAAEALVSRGFVFLPCTCVDSGKEAPVGEGVCCVRCGVAIHPEYANMLSGFDPPYCARCRWPLLLLGR